MMALFEEKLIIVIFRFIQFEIFISDETFTSSEQSESCRIFWNRKVWGKKRNLQKCHWLDYAGT